MQTVMSIITAALSFYMLLIFLRILLTWFQGPSLGRAYEFLMRVTDPYLNYFRRFKFLRTERIDFSPILAIIVLVIILNITNTIAAYGTITLGIVLALIISALWSAFSFLLLFFFVLTMVRFIALLIGTNFVSPIWRTIDVIIQPLVTK